MERHEPALEAQIAEVREVAELLRRQLEDVRADRDAWREQAQAGQRLLSFDKSSGPPDRKPWWRRLAVRAVPSAVNAPLTVPTAMFRHCWAQKWAMILAVRAPRKLLNKGERSGRMERPDRRSRGVSPART